MASVSSLSKTAHGYSDFVKVTFGFNVELSSSSLWTWIEILSTTPTNSWLKGHCCKEFVIAPFLFDGICQVPLELRTIDFKTYFSLKHVKYLD